jgi:HlyD family secretion protein
MSVAEPTPTGISDSGRREVLTGAIALALFFGGFLAWAAFAPLDAAIVGPGVVVVSGNRQTLQHRDGGVISQLSVREGQRVHAGEILIEIGAPEIVAQRQVLLSQLIDLQLQRARLRADAGGTARLEKPAEWATFSADERAVADAAFARYGKQGGASRSGAWSEYDARIQGYRDEIAAVARQETLLQDELTGVRTLAAKNLVSTTRVRALERNLAELDGRRASLRALIASTAQERIEALRQTEARIAEITPQLAGARERLERTRLRAPVDGVVVGIKQNTVGGVIAPGEHVLDIVPEGQELVIEARFRPEDVEGLHTDMRAEVRITAFRGRSVGIVYGVVRRVSADRLLDERTGAPYFTAQIFVPRDELARITGPAQGGRTLRAGLPAEVIIPTRKRTVLAYLLEPLNQTLWRSLRES